MSLFVSIDYVYAAGSYNCHRKSSDKLDDAIHFSIWSFTDSGDSAFICRLQRL